MLAFKKIFISLFLTFAVIFLFIFLIRLANSKEGFMGFNDLLSYFENKVDLYKPLTRFQQTFDKLKKAVNDFVDSVNFNSIFGSSSGGGGRGTPEMESNFWKDLTNTIGSIFGWLGNNIVNFFKMLYTILAMPIMLIFDVVALFVDYFKIFIDFISYIIHFEGYTSSTLIVT